MMRRIELPPLTDESEIRQAVHFQAQDEIPMPPESVVLDYHTLGIVDGPAGPRLQVLLVAARRDMVGRIVQAAQLAGVQPEGVDLAAFGMIRALRPAGADASEQILYLSVGGLTNLAISRGPVCEFTRVITWGVEQIAADVASRCAIPLDDARRLLVTTGLEPGPTPAPAPSPDATSVAMSEIEITTPSFSAPLAPAIQPPSVPEPNAQLVGVPAPVVDQEQVVRAAISEGVRRIGAEVRHSLDFYFAAQPDTPLSRAVLCGPALEIPGLVDTLSSALGLPIVRGEVELASGDTGDVPASILPIAAGLSLTEGPA
jgi:type IV pilus assembly protein PilM